MEKVDVSTILEEERKAEQKLSEVKKRADEILNKAREEARRIINEASIVKENEEISRMKMEERAKVEAELEKLEKMYEEKLKRLIEFLEKNRGALAKHVFDRLIGGER